MSNSEPDSSKTLNLTTKFLSGKILAVAVLVIVSSLTAIFQEPFRLLPLLSCCFGVVVSGILILPILQKLKTGQVIREDGPQTHLKKGGTPTMGGIFVVPVGIVGSLAWTGFDIDIVAACLLTLGFAIVGWLDDWQILRYKSNKGISPKAKLALQSIFTIALCVWIGFAHPENASVNLPFNLVLPLGILFFPLAIFVLIGASNATNFTDGLDGLAGGTGAIALVGIGCLLSQSLLPTAQNPNLAIFCTCMGGSYLGFLWHNHNPARVFMGDTGSLALGGAIASAAILGNMLWGLLIIGAIFVWEVVSVILQVSYYKATKDDQGVGKRLFKMAPYHHHLELSGWKETQVVGVFYVSQTLLVVLAIAINLYAR